MAPAAKTESAGVAGGANPPVHSVWQVAEEGAQAASAPGADDEAQRLEPGAIFAAARVAAVGGQRFFQLAAGRAWVPERCRKDPSRFFVKALPSDDAAVEAAASAALEAAGGRSGLPAPHPQAHVRLRYLRIEVLSTRSANTANTQMAQIALRCRNRVLSLDGFAVENPDGQSPPNEFPEKLLAARGKFLDLNFRARRRTVLIVTAPFEIEVDDVAIRTGSDAPGRDPTSLRIDGSRDGWEWRTLHEAAETPYLVPEKRLAWSPWLQLRPGAGASDEEAGDARRGAWSPVASEAPAAISWWRNVGKRLGVLKVPREGLEPQDHLQPGVMFPAIRVFTNSGRRYLQLPGGRGWVPECSRKDASRIVVAPCEPLSLPAPLLVPPPPAAEGEEPEAKRARLAQERSHLSFASPAGAVRLRRLRLRISGTRSAESASCCLGQVALRCSGELVNFDGFVAEGRSAPEAVLTAHGEWRDDGFGAARSSELLLVAPEEVAVEDIALRTGSAESGSDPVAIRVEASVDGETWLVLHDTGEISPLPLERLAWSPWLFLLKNPSAKAPPPPSADAAS